MIPISTIQTIPAYGTQTIPIFGNAITPSINYGLTSPIISTVNYGTTSIATGPITTLAQPQMPTPILMPNIPRAIVLPQKDNQSHILNDYPIDENDPRRFPRYCVYTLPISGYGYGYNYDYRTRTGLPLNSVRPILNQTTQIPVTNTNLPGVKINPNVNINP